MRIKFEILLILTALSLISCEKVIDIDLNDSEPRLVVEAAVSTNPGSSFVILTKSVNFKQTNIPTVSGAQISVEDLTNQTVYNFSEVGPGIYTNDLVVAVEGHSYKLNINTGGKTYTSVSGFKKNVPLTSLEQKPASSIFVSDAYEITPIFTDPADNEDYYLFNYTRNDSIQKDILLMNDLGYNGQQNTRSFLITAKKNDVIKFEMQCIDKPVYNYMLGYRGNIINYSATPSNPPSNISNGALGFFKVHSSSVKQTIMK